MAAPRLLHTSDWHLGATLGAVDREVDHVVALDSLVALATESRPDVIVHTGDLFDSARPGAPAQRLAVETLHRLSEVAPVVLIAGNHDNGPMLHTVWQPLVDFGAVSDRIHIRGLLRRPADGGAVKVPRRDGTGAFYICCTPYISVHAYASWSAGSGAPDGRPLTPTELYADGLANLARGFDTWLGAAMDPAVDIAVSAAHVLVSGAQPGGSERKVHEADDFATAVAQLPHVAYGAFGHIHRPQALPGGRVPAHYAGSVIPIDYGEGHETKSTVLVEFGTGGVARPRQIPHDAGRPLVEVAGTLDALALERDRCAGAIVKALVTTTEPTPGLAGKVAAALGPAATIFAVREDRHGELAPRPSGEGGTSTLPGLLGAWLATNRIAAPDPRRSAAIVEALVDAATTETTVRFDAEALVDDGLLDLGDAEDIRTVTLS